MAHDAAAILTPWANFYVIVGSAAAALTGLVFVVITIVTSNERVPRSAEATATFTTPTVVHFGAALLVSVAMSVPWPALAWVASVIAATGLYGCAYVLRIAVRIHRMSDYGADSEDWICHTFVPLLAYGTLLAGGIALAAWPAGAAFALALSVVVLVFIGIHNAWDIVTYIAVRHPGPEPATPSASARKDASD